MRYKKLRLVKKDSYQCKLRHKIKTSNMIIKCLNSMGCGFEYKNFKQLLKSLYIKKRNRIIIC